MKRDLTSGNVAWSLFSFALPMILGNLMQQLYNIADMWVVGKFVGSDAVAAAGSAYSLVTFLTSVFIGLCMGSGALMSYYGGRQDKDRLRSCVLTSFVLIGAISVLLSIAVLLFSRPILTLLQTPVEIFDMLESYVRLLVPGLIFIFLYNYFAFALRSTGNSVVPLVFLCVSSVINIILDILFVAGFSLGLDGAAIATVISQIIAGVGAAVYVCVKEPIFRPSFNEFLHGDKPIGEILHFSLVSSAQQSVMNFGILMIQGLVNSFGVAVMSAFAAAVKIDTFAYMPAQEFGNAYSILISQNHGAGKNDRIADATKKALLASIAFCLLVSLVIFIFAPSLMGIFIDAADADIISIGVQYLRIEGAFYALIGILFLLYGYFRGINRPTISFILTIISLGMRVILAYALSAVDFIGVVGIWWSIPIGWLLADIAGFVFMRRVKIQCSNHKTRQDWVSD
ncbi:MAG: MATE family efflux transporter [Clostridiales bacterium]|nr:MATE family efflux transporter [Clostridiales bacterium]